MASLALRSGLLGRRLAAHLLRRATFGPTRAEIDDLANRTADEAVDLLMNFPPLPNHPKDPATSAEWVVNGRTTANSPNNELKYIVNSWWLDFVLNPTTAFSIAHKLTFFLHTSFVTSFNDILWSENHYYTLRLLMLYANKSYKELAKKICLDNGMNNFLDISDSSKGNPNENFVREFLELFTIGKGPGAGPGDYTTFTEQDVIEAARLMTGFRINNNWNDPLLIDQQTGLPRAWMDTSRHDETDKIFSHRFNSTIISGQTTEAGMLQEVDDLVEMIFAQPATAEYICRRLYRFFVKYDISQEVEDDIIVPLANTLRSNNYNLSIALSQLLKSEHFYDGDDSDTSDEVIGSLIKPPLDLQIGMIRYLQLAIPDPNTDLFGAYVNFYRWGMQDPQSKACFDLFGPPEVAGYEPIYQAPKYNRLWISAKSIPGRYAIVDEHIEGPPELEFDIMGFVNDPTQITDFSGVDPQGTPGPHAGGRIAPHLVDELLNYLLPETLDQDRRDYFLKDVLLDTLTELNWMFEWDNYVSTNDDSNIKPQITKLIRTILQSPEFQLS
ncbi:MAG: DUF1800 family protein [Bacteroidetes bacterium]|nr:DUF1800 family protein [Bacteroidota bacterium]MCB0843234.1 DUF1800 family protein [Bacteroidota bacterium]